MNAIKRELTRRGILHEANEYDYMKDAEYDMCERLVTVTREFIITVFHSAVLPSEIRLYDRTTLFPIGGQNLLPERCSFFRYNKWDSYFYENML